MLVLVAPVLVLVAAVRKNTGAGKNTKPGAEKHRCWKKHQARCGKTPVPVQKFFSVFQNTGAEKKTPVFFFTGVTPHQHHTPGLYKHVEVKYK